MGPTSQAVEYFSTIGFDCPEMFNPTDFFLDIISGRVASSRSLVSGKSFLATPVPSREDRLELPPSSLYQRALRFSMQLFTPPIPPPSPSPETQKFEPAELISLWKQHSASFESKVAASQSTRTLMTSIHKRETPGVVWQTVIYFKRCSLELVRDLKGLAIEFGAQVIAGNVSVIRSVDWHSGVGMGMSGISREIVIPPISLELAQTCPLIVRDRCLQQAVEGQGAPITAFFLTYQFAIEPRLMLCQYGGGSGCGHVWR